ncbi:MAG: SMC-Scp complex subunit ScpB [Lentisphaerae bacterium]|nr:SMC-Scp complex subunit ScpB [Lentisphaerota bacterium]
MSESNVLPELKQIIGAMIFGADRSLNIKEMRKCLLEVASEYGGETSAFGSVKDTDIRNALSELTEDLKIRKTGFHLVELAGGFRLQSDVACGKWLRHLLKIGKPNRLSRPALETLAIIAYRQPVSRPDIESIRGVNVDHIVRTLMELQLVKITGRSHLPGKPFLYGTTQAFLEHFGLKNLNELKDMHPALVIPSESAHGKIRPEQIEPVFESDDKNQYGDTIEDELDDDNDDSEEE